MQYLILFSLLFNQVFARTFKSDVHKLASEGHESVKSYRVARKIIFQKIYLENKRRFFVQGIYCQRVFSRGVGPNQMPHHRSVNIEHAWPRSKFRVPKGSHGYKMRLSDLHALYPTDSRANSIRGSHQFAELNLSDEIENCETSRFGRDFQNGNLGFEPPNNVKGDIARSLLYFAIRYKYSLPETYEFMLRRWHQKDPVDTFELSKHNQIKAIQGNINPFVLYPELVESIVDF